jgi:hypothetical protein
MTDTPYTPTLFQKVSREHPLPHAKYVVLRSGKVFTATPCYGMHKPWWVVRLMPETWPNEAEPVPFEDDDLWCELSDFNVAAVNSYARHFGARAIEAAEGDWIGEAIEQLIDAKGLAMARARPDDARAHGVIQRIDALLAKTEPTQ